MIKLPDSTVIKKYRTIWIFLHYLINLIVQDQWKGGHCFLVRTSRCIQFQSRESRVRLLPLTPMLSETNPELRHFEMVPPLDTAQIPSPLATSPPNLCCPGTHIWNLGQTLLQLWRFFGLSRPRKGVHRHTLTGLRSQLLSMLATFQPKLKSPSDFFHMQTSNSWHKKHGRVWKSQRPVKDHNLDMC